MIVALLVATFLVTFFTGPAGKEILENRRLSLDEPKAKVIYLPSAACRGSEPQA